MTDQTQPPSSSEKPQALSTTAPPAVEKNDLYTILRTNFDLTELEECSFELGVPFEDLAGGEMRQKKALALVEYMERHGRLPELVQVVYNKRPLLEVWQTFSPAIEDTQTASDTSTTPSWLLYGLASGTVILVVVLIIFVWSASKSSPVPDQQPRLQIGIADFKPETCTAVAQQLTETLQEDNPQLLITSPANLTEGEGEALNLIISGTCLDDGLLELRFQFMHPNTPAEFLNQPEINIQVSALDLQDGERIAQAAADYIAGNYDAVALTLDSFRRQVRQPDQAGQTAVTLWWANSLLLQGRYEAAIDAYSEIADAEPFLARQNRALAAFNLAFSLARQEADSQTSWSTEELIEMAQADFTAVLDSNDPTVQAITAGNLGALYYWYGPDYEVALHYCQLAVDAAPDHPFGYLCQGAAGTRLQEETEAFCEFPPELPDSAAIRQALAQAEGLTDRSTQPDIIAAIAFWRGSLNGLLAACSQDDNEASQYSQDSKNEYTTACLILDNQAHYQLYTHRLMQMFSNCQPID